jgi:hypothetical protein
MSTPHEKMVAALKQTVVPQLRSRGFRGTFPHFRRIGPEQVDLLTFQFDKWGGGFVIEIARCAPEGIVHPWGKRIPAADVTVWNVHPRARLRLQPLLGSSTSDWFRYDQPAAEEGIGVYAEVAEHVLPYLESADKWWRGEDDPYIRSFEAHFRGT